MKHMSSSVAAPAAIRLNLKSGGGTTGDPILVNVSGSAEYEMPKASQRGVSESKMWKEFHSHFSKKNRDRGVKVNHHDFLDLPNLAASTNGRFSLGRLGGGKYDTTSLLSNDTFSSQMNNQLMATPADLIFAGPNERLQNKLRIFNNMK
jgi:hypothetical protein